MMQIASRAILVNTRPPGSLAAGSREDAPIETRPLETSEMPTFDPPWRILNPNFLPFLVLIHLRASWVSSGKTEVDPLIVMIFFACATAGTAANSDNGGDQAPAGEFPFVTLVLLSVSQTRTAGVSRRGQRASVTRP